MNLLVFLLTLRVTSVVQGCQQSGEMKKKTDEETVGRGNIGKNAMVVSGGLNGDNDNVWSSHFIVPSSKYIGWCRPVRCGGLS